MLESEDRERRRVFMRLTEKERFEALYSMITFQASQRAADSKLLAEAHREIEYMKAEIVGISHRRQDTLSTSDKINTELNKRGAGWTWYRDKVLASTLATVQTLVIMALLYLAFGGKVP